MRRKQVKDLIEYDSPEYNELQEWLIKHFGPITHNDFWSTEYVFGKDWAMIKRYKWNYNIRAVEWYVEFDARCLPRSQMTWFRLKWQK